MFCIKNKVINESIINKSKFICIIVKVDNIDKVNYYLNFYKNTYKNATHYCYAYIIDNDIKFSDDKEPIRTAGMPILNVLQKNKLNHVLAIVIRYFGGIKLGKGGLIRAYSNSVINTLEKTEIVKLEKGYLVSLSFNYHNIKFVDNLLKNYNINKTFNDKIIYKFEIKIDDFNKIEHILIDKNIEINKKTILITV